MPDRIRFHLDEHVDPSLINVYVGNRHGWPGELARETVVKVGRGGLACQCLVELDVGATATAQSVQVESRRTGSEKVEDVLHPNAEFPNARAATAHVWVHRDSLCRAHVLPTGRPTSDRAILRLLAVFVRICTLRNSLPGGAHV